MFLVREGPLGSPEQKKYPKRPPSKFSEASRAPTRCGLGAVWLGTHIPIQKQLGLDKSTRQRINTNYHGIIPAFVSGLFWTFLEISWEFRLCVSFCYKRKATHNCALPEVQRTSARKTPAISTRKCLCQKLAAHVQLLVNF